MMNNTFEEMIEQIINEYKNTSNQDLALVYALEMKCYPFFHENLDILSKLKKFENDFSITKEEAGKFYEYIDELIASQNYKTFYEIQDIFGGKENYHKIIFMLKYAVLAERFCNEEFKNKLLEKGNFPINAEIIFKPYNINEEI